MISQKGYTASAFGVCWVSDLPLYPFAPAAPGKSVITIERTDRLLPRASPRKVNVGEVYSDGFRMRWRNEVVFDMLHGNRITYLPCSAWSRQLPTSLFSTVVALTLAWRGDLPLHACAVEVGGEAFLIAGPAGSGKSVLTADLLTLGAYFVSDDLSVIRFAHSGLTICPGRTTMRLHPSLSEEIDASDRWPVKGDERGKWQLRPNRRTTLREMPVAGMLLLDGGREPISRVDRPLLLLKQLFRPRWMAALPNHRSRLERILHHGSIMPIVRFPAIDVAGLPDRARRAGEAMDKIIAMQCR